MPKKLCENDNYDCDDNNGDSNNCVIVIIGGAVIISDSNSTDLNYIKEG